MIFDRFTALDAIGPYEVLSRLPGAELSFVAKEAGPKRSDTGALGVSADLPIAELPDPEIVLVPGGEGNRPLLSDDRVLEWLRSAHETSVWTTSVCTGSLVLGAAGILDRKRATSHWVYLEGLRSFGAEPVDARVVEDGKVMTAAGVSSGIDMALTLAARVAGDQVARAIQLGIEYDPEPPFDAGSPAKAPPELVELVRNLEREPAPSRRA
ncbi:MAG: inhA [Solirubrobacterales bacterium]|jgi:transcriptional regulator GlxA family with amidase domain|nr:inhA [Solirubrobacterales bacterium]